MEPLISLNFSVKMCYIIQNLLFDLSLLKAEKNGVRGLLHFKRTPPLNNTAKMCSLCLESQICGERDQIEKRRKNFTFEHLHVEDYRHNWKLHKSPAIID